MLQCFLSVVFHLMKYGFVILERKHYKNEVNQFATDTAIVIMGFLLLLLLLLQYNKALAAIELSTPYGKVLGSKLETRLGKTIYAFRGIKYAEAPINELRFKPPVPITKWINNKIYNATEDAPACPQPYVDPVSEDCLYLNVYTTKLPKCGSPNPNRAVIVFLHPGGFYSFSGRSDYFGPQYFLDQDIVLVTLNYRLGSLGFLSIGKEVPGNNGLKDQVVALKWVKNNIKYFGGNADSITVYGYSAGAVSVTLHMVSLMSRGLFHKAIIASESALGPLPYTTNQINIAYRQAEILGCSNTSLKVILDCLKSKPANDFVKTGFEFTEFGIDPLVIWTPVIEKDYGQERFISENPIKLFQNGDFEKIPVIAGITKDEFGFRAFYLLSNETWAQQLNENFEKYAPICFIYERATPKSKEVSQCIRKFYLNNEPITNSSLQGLANIYADSITGYPVYRAVNLISQNSNKPVFYYDFTYQARFSFFYIPGTIQPFGVVHHDDLQYLFYISKYFPFFNSSFPETKMIDKLTTMWANFAKTSNPTPQKTAELNNVKWETYNIKTKKYLEIGNELVIKKNFYGDRYSLWDKLYPINY